MTKPVLVVDDDETLRTTIGEFLQEEGFSVRLAANGSEALSVLMNGEHPCLILLDLMMPVMNGWDVVERLGRDDTLVTIPIVIMTAHPLRNPARGGPQVLRKPMSVQTLLETVRQHCSCDAKPQGGPSA